MAVPNQPLAAKRIRLTRVRGEKRIEFRPDRLRNQVTRTLAQQIRQRVGRKPFWRAKRDNRIFRHVACMDAAVGARVFLNLRACDRVRSCIRPVLRLEYDRWPVWSYADLVQNQLYELVAH